MTIEESMHVKLEESNSLVKNTVEIDSLGEIFEKIFIINLPAQEEDDKKKDGTNGKGLNIEVEPIGSINNGKTNTKIKMNNV